VPALQGDLEYVPFDPQRPADVFSKLSEMINGLLAGAAGTTVSTVVTERQEETQVAVEPTVAQVAAEASKEEGAEADIISVYIEMIRAAERCDLEGVATAWRAGSDLIATGKDDQFNQVEWDSFYFQNRFEAGATDALEELRRLAAQNPDRFEPKRSMAYCYYSSKEFDSAAPLYLEAAKFKGDKWRARNFIMAAKAFLEMTRYDEAIDAVESALPIAPDDVLDEAISLQYRLLKERGDGYLAFATAEAALHYNPQLSVRFTLGLDYRGKELHEVSLYHFKFLHDRNKTDSSSLHNLALVSDDCKLPISAVERYRAAFEMGETLSAANLGYTYLECGMAQEAKALIEAAIAVKDHVPRVEKCLAEITQRREHEAEKETEVLKQAAERRSLFIDMGRALSSGAPPIDGSWKFPFGEIPLAVVSGRVEGAAELKRQRSVTVALLLGGVGSEQPARVDTYVLSGKLRGAVCEFQVTIREKGGHASGSAILGAEPSKSGFIVFSPDGNSAKYVELSDRKLGKTKIIKRS
jgi:tetratricopeptide (TPR) repeat protein